MADELVQKSFWDTQDLSQTEGTGEEAQENVSLALFAQSAPLTTSDVQIPRIRLMQGLSDEVTNGHAKIGQIILTGFPPVDTLTVIPVGFQRRRELREQNTFSLLCRSTDGEVGVGYPGGSCAVCPMATWTGEGDQRTPPACSFMYTYLVYAPEVGSLALLDFKKTTLQVGKVLNTIVMQRGLRNFSVVLGSTRATSKKGAYYVYTVTPEQVNSAAVAKVLANAGV